MTESQVGVEELPVELPESSLCPEGQSLFEWQVHQFISQVELPTEMYQRLNEVMNEVEDLFSSELPGCRVIVFGSCGTTLAFKNSDVDLFLQCAGDQPQDFVKREAKVMYRSRQFQILARIPNARVPIMKFQHLKTGFQCDLTTKSRLGVCNSRLIRFLISLDPRIRPLLMLVKYWGKVYGVTGSNNRLTTYSLVMLVIFYLQQLNPPILPSVATLQRLADIREFSLGWECSFCDEEWKLRSETLMEVNNLPLIELLIGFFHFYNTFDYKNVICPLLGRAIPVLDFEDPKNLPGEMHIYKEKLKSDPKLEFRTNLTLKVQDPFELCLNITRNVCEKTVSLFRKACTVSCEISEKEDEGSLLESLFSISQESLDTGAGSCTICIAYKKDPNETTTLFSDVSQWYELTTEAVLLVMREVMKLRIEPNHLETSSKVKKLESSQDVHTLPESFSSSDDLVYICSGNADVWTSRKKTSKLMNSVNISLNGFEREVCISNALYHPTDTSIVACNLLISSFDKFKSSRKGVDVVITVKKTKGKNQIKAMMNFLKRSLKNLVLEATNFIKKTRGSSSVAGVKESMRELFDLKLATLPDLNNCKNYVDESLNKECPVLSEVKKNEKILKQQKLLLQSLGISEQSIQGCNKECTSTSHPNYVVSTSQEEQTGPVNSEAEKVTHENEEDQVMRSVFSSRHMPSAETQAVINEFLKPNNPDYIITSQSSDEGVNIENKQFCNILKTVKKCETQSTFTCEGNNPFLTSIEHLKIKLLTSGDKHNDENKNVTLENSENQSTTDFNDKGKKIIESNTYDCPPSKDVTKEGCRPNFKPVQQRPKVYVERPHKYRKPNPTRPNLNQPQAESRALGEHRRIGLGPYGQQAYSRQTNTTGSASDYQYYSEYIDDNRHGNFNRSDKYQRHIAKSTDKHKLWFPTLFKQN